MRFSRQLGEIAAFAVAALAVYVVGSILLAAWPMWTMMWSMVGFGPGGLILTLVAVGLGVGAIWLIGRAGRQDVATATTDHCPRCRAAVEPDYILCPECDTALRASCRVCQRPLQAPWTHCPYCGSAATPPVATAGAASAGREVGYDGR